MKKLKECDIHRYIDKEVRLRVEAFNIYSKDKNAEDLKHYLKCPLDELDIDEIIEIYKKDLKRTFEGHRNHVITGKLSERVNITVRLSRQSGVTWFFRILVT